VSAAAAAKKHGLDKGLVQFVTDTKLPRVHKGWSFVAAPCSAEPFDDEEWRLVDRIRVSSAGRVQTLQSNGFFSEKYRPRSIDGRMPRVCNKPLAKLVYIAFGDPEDEWYKHIKQGRFCVTPRDGDMNNMRISNLVCGPYVHKPTPSTFKKGVTSPYQIKQRQRVKSVRNGVERIHESQTACAQELTEVLQSEGCFSTLNQGGVRKCIIGQMATYKGFTITRADAPADA
jgi:hypothetical protein